MSAPPDEGPASGTSESQPRELEWSVLRAQAGDRAALETLLTRVETMLRPFLSAMLPDQQLREDVMQEALVLVYRRVSTLRDSRAFPAWCRRIAAREAMRALRNERSRWELLDELGDDTPDPVGVDALAIAEEADIHRLIGSASPASRTVLALHYIDGLTLDEIAAVLDLPIGTIKSRLAYGLAAMRRGVTEGRSSLRPG